jgi:hypothetical protein
MTTAPMRFSGTQAQRDANRDSHFFINGRCADCDCRPWGRVAEWPCGVEPPRVTDEGAAREFDARFSAYAAAGGVA